MSRGLAGRDALSCCHPYGGFSQRFEELVARSATLYCVDHARRSLRPRSDGDGRDKPGRHISVYPALPVMTGRVPVPTFSGEAIPGFR